MTVARFRSRNGAQNGYEASMFYRTKTWCISILLLLSAVFCAASSAIAQDAAWHVDKVSGDIWVTKQGVQAASLSGETTLQPGDTIRTGQTGRVLLLRGKESILISPNSVIEIPTKNADGMSTTIIQRAGSILLEVEKRNVRHFEVDTPYLAAVVKGTQFRVTVEDGRSHVNVLRGQVEVVDFKSGQFALVTPGQEAEVSARDSSGLSLSGAGPFGAIQYGTPRSSPVTPVSVRAAGLLAPTSGAQSAQAPAASGGLSGPSTSGSGSFGVHEQGIPSGSPPTPVSVRATGLLAPIGGPNVGQTHAASHALSGSSFSGNGALGAIQQGKPHSSPVAPVSVWATGLLAPNSGSEQDQAVSPRSSILPRTTIRSLLASSEKIAAKEDVQASAPIANDSGPGADDKMTSEIETPPQTGFLSSLALPLEVGFFVIFAVTIFRRIGKKTDGRPPEYDY
jgi:FecR protein